MRLALPAPSAAGDAVDAVDAVDDVDAGDGGASADTVSAALEVRRRLAANNLASWLTGRLAAAASAALTTSGCVSDASVNLAMTTPVRAAA